MDGWMNEWITINLFWGERKVREDKRQASLPDPGRCESEGREREATAIQAPPFSYIWRVTSCRYPFDSTDAPQDSKRFTNEAWEPDL